MTTIKTFAVAVALIASLAACESTTTNANLIHNQPTDWKVVNPDDIEDLQKTIDLLDEIHSK